MREKFKIQAIRKTRRMPNAKHYGDDILDCSYVYTFHEEFINDFKDEGAFEVNNLFLKDEVKDLKVYKEIRSKDTRETYRSTKESREVISNFFKDKYSLSDDFEKNKTNLENGGYIFNENIIGRYVTGRYSKLDDITKAPEIHRTLSEVNKKTHGQARTQIINDLKRSIHIKYDVLNTILMNLFMKTSRVRKKEDFKLLELNNKQFSAFIINNKDKLSEDFKDIRKAELIPTQETLNIEDKLSFEISLPRQEVYRYDSDTLHPVEYTKNVYEGYSSAFTVEELRLKSERLFERYCELCDDIKYFYKNGDRGAQYISIVYKTGYKKEFLFYPDYLLTLKDDTNFIVETKGGEISNQSKDIDSMSPLKFQALKHFAEKHGYGFAFVRDKNDELYMCNNEYTEEMNEDNWKPINFFE